MRQYLDAVKQILDTGTRKPNRTGVDSLSTFGIHYNIDLQRGFPLLTTKSISWKNIVVEMLWFLSGQTDISILKKHGCKFWDDWVDKDGKVPSAYGNFHRRFPAEHRLVEVPARIVQKPERQIFLRRHLPDLLSAGTGGRFGGQVFESAMCGRYVVLEETGRDGQGRSLHTVQFVDTGYVATEIRGDVVQNGQLRDPFYPSVCGVGHVGSRAPETDLDRDLYKTWQHMLERCYVPQCKEYVLYGERGVFVDDRWLSFSNFREDCSLLPGWVDKLGAHKERQLDKDYYGSNCYSKDTCVWLSKRDNIRLQKARAFRVETPDGDSFIDISRNDVAEMFDLSPTCIGDVLSGKQSDTKGYRFKYLDDGKNYRYPFPNDQIRWLVDTLKRDPSSRRMVVSAWAPGNAQTSKLPPCHCLFVVNVQNYEPPLPEGGYAVDSEGHLIRPVEQRLCLHLTQRSCDIALGVPYNIASYALLMHLLSRFSGIPVGTFSHTLVDAHAYTSKADGSKAEFDHVPGLREQLTREPRPLPQLHISDEIKSLEDVERLMGDDISTEEVMKHFVLDGYEPWPAIPFRVAV